MAINTETFFGRSTSTSTAPVATGATVSGSTRTETDVQPAANPGNEEKKSILSELIQIDKDVKKIQKLIAKGRVLRKKEQENNKKQDENKKREEKELRLEKKKERNLPGIKATPFPKMGFLDRIRQFLFYTLLGSAFVKFGKHIPEILKFTKLLVPAFEFFEKLTGNILNGIVDFIGAGYKAQDKIKEIAKTVGGEDLEKKFDEFNKQFNTFANLAIIAGLAATGGGMDFGDGKRERLGVDKQTGKKVSKRSQARFLERYGEKAYVEKFGKRSYKGLTGKTAGRLTGRFAGKALGKIPIIGGLVDFIISTVIFKEKPGRAAAKALGSTIGSALGTFVPFPFAGTILGGIVGDLVGGALYDSLIGDDKLKAKAKGGQVTRGGKKVGGAVKRTIRKVRSKPPKIQPQKSIPGKDIGGKKQIEKLFPTTTDPRQKNPLGVLETSSKEYKKIPLIGELMGSAIDSDMGQRIDNRVFKKFGIGLGYLIQSAIDSETTASISNIQRQIIGLAGGGMIPRTLSTNENVGIKIGERIAKTLQTMVNSKVSNTLQAIRQQLNKQGIYDSGGVPEMDGTATGEVAVGTIARGQLSMEQLVGLAKGAGFSDSDAVIMAAIAMAESGGNSNAHNRKPPDNSYGLWQINMIGNLGPERRKQFGISNDAQLKDPVTNAHAARLIKKSQGFGAWTVYKTGAYKRYLGSAQKVSSAPKITVYKPTTTGGFVPLGDEQGNLEEVRKLAESFGVPLYSHVRPGDPGYHGSGRAMDFSNDAVGKGTPEQLKLAQELVKKYGKTAKEIIYTPLGFSIKNGKQVPPIDPGNHYHHVHVAFEDGGKVRGLTRAILGEKGPEFVLDADTTAALEENYPGFLDSLNKSNYKGALRVLQNYAEYYNPSKSSTIMIQRVIVEKTIPVTMGRTGSSTIIDNTQSTPTTAALSIG
jgi:hypothetical protein